MTWQDISVPIRNEMVTFEGDPTVHLERAASMAAGAVCNISRLDFGVHSGTHVDAPVHFIDGAAGIETVPLAVRSFSFTHTCSKCHSHPGNRYHNFIFAFYNFPYHIFDI